MLEVKSLTCRYGSVTALQDANLRVDEGELVCLLGSNGAGKSTLVKGISGVLPPASGQVIFQGRDLTGRKTSEMVRSGLIMVAEGRRIFRSMSVADNLTLGGYVRRKDTDGLAKTRKEVLEAFPILRDKINDPAGSLSGGQQQMLAMAQALMGAPKLLILDEPSLGLAPSVVAIVFDIIAKLRASGMAMILVEQMVGRALSVADRGYVLQTGRIVAEGTADELHDDEAVRHAYLGEAQAA
jgi:branched-chain amino acid transport system ATP-binding protein